MPRFIITFGQQHAHHVNGVTFDKDSVAVIKAENEALARAKARELFKNEYHNCTPEKQFDASNSLKWFPRGKLEAN
jgi:hypothetical protein